MDHNATTFVDDRARDAMSRVLEEVHGNPSSLHEEGRRARAVVENARTCVARLLGGQSEEIVFTSGGTEADILGILGLARHKTASQSKRLLTTHTVHPAIFGATKQLAQQGWKIDFIRVDPQGNLDETDLARQCQRGASVLALSLANHEIGVVQDMERASSIAHSHDIHVHCDAVQAAGKIPIDVTKLGIDTLALSAHKFGGPKGVGALWTAPSFHLAPLFAAGHQERDRRPGTENVPGIAGMGVAAHLATSEGLADSPRLEKLRNSLEAQVLELPETAIYGQNTTRVCNTASIGFAGASGEIIAAALDLAGFAVSTGAACTSGKTEPSPVLCALGLSPQQARQVIRISLGKCNTEADIHAFMEVIPEILTRARQYHE